MVHEQIQDLSSFRMYPEIYKYNYTAGKSEKIFPTSVNTVATWSSFFNSLSNNVMYIECSSPILTYSDDNELFNLGFLLKDQNQSPVLFNYLFEYTDEIKFVDTNYYLATNNNFTDIFVDNTVWDASASSEHQLDLQTLSFSLCTGRAGMLSATQGPAISL